MRKIILVILTVNLPLIANAQPCTTTIIEDGLSDSNHVFLTAHIIPQFPGGEEAFYNFLQKNLKYPKQAKISHAEGLVYVEFIVEEDGSLTSVRAIKWSNQYLAEEAVRVVKLIPKFIPGTIRGKPIRMKLTLPIQFLLEG